VNEAQKQAAKFWKWLGSQQSDFVDMLSTGEFDWLDYDEFFDGEPPVKGMLGALDRIIQNWEETQESIGDSEMGRLAEDLRAIMGNDDDLDEGLSKEERQAVKDKVAAHLKKKAKEKTQEKVISGAEDAKVKKKGNIYTLSYKDSSGEKVKATGDWRTITTKKGDQVNVFVTDAGKFMFVPFLR
jgi:hypothetical protein